MRWDEYFRKRSNIASKLHLDMLKKVVTNLTPSLKEQIVFVGGCTTCLFVDDVS